MSASQIVIASGNAGKIREFDRLFSDWPLKVVSQRELGVTEVPETGLSFLENALIKARNAAAVTGLPAIADDSGLEVDALDGAPGIYSARYSQDSAGDNYDDASNNTKLLQALMGVPQQQRSARFVCVLAFMRHENDPTPVIASGFWEGRILSEACGTQGFGYDPLFWVPEFACSSAELDPAVKNQHSHRAKAMQSLATLLQQREFWPLA